MNVLKITTTPIKLSMSAQKAGLESHLPEPELGIIRTPSRLNMKSENIKVNIDTSAARDSLGFKTARSLNRDAAVFDGQSDDADPKRGDYSRNCTEPDDGPDKGYDRL